MFVQGTSCSGKHLKNKAQKTQWFFEYLWISGLVKKFWLDFSLIGGKI